MWWRSISPGLNGPLDIAQCGDPTLQACRVLGRLQTSAPRGGKECRPCLASFARTSGGLPGRPVCFALSCILSLTVVSLATAKPIAHHTLPARTSAPALARGSTGPAVVASGTLLRAYVSRKGIDTNPCTAGKPCRTFGAAIAKSVPGGEVIVLDSGSYSPVTVGSSISLFAPPGVDAGIIATTGSAITVAAGASDVVTLRGLTLNGLGGTYGIQVDSVGAVYIEENAIKNFSNYGILVFPTTPVSVRIEGTTVTHSGISGVFLGNVPSGPSVRGTIVDSRFEDGSHGVEVYFKAEVSVQNSVATGNQQIGFYAEGSSGNLSLDNCLATHNLYGEFAYGTLYSSSTMIVRNDTGVSAASGGSVIS
jgi:Right handed beta helix region